MVAAPMRHAITGCQISLPGPDYRDVDGSVTALARFFMLAKARAISENPSNRGNPWFLFSIIGPHPDRG